MALLTLTMVILSQTSFTYSLMKLNTGTQPWKWQLKILFISQHINDTKTHDVRVISKNESRACGQGHCLSERKVCDTSWLHPVLLFYPEIRISFQSCLLPGDPYCFSSHYHLHVCKLDEAQLIKCSNHKDDAKANFLDGHWFILKISFLLPLFKVFGLF